MHPGYIIRRSIGESRLSASLVQKDIAPDRECHVTANHALSGGAIPLQQYIRVHPLGDPWSVTNFHEI